MYCGEDYATLHAHHTDYTKPLLVTWLCPACHLGWHAENGPGANWDAAIPVEPGGPGFFWRGKWRKS
jgi:hypothetical protein